MKISALPILIAFSLLVIGLLPNAHAVSPPPVGAYPGGTTATGQDALLSLTTGTYNTAIGIYALKTNTTGGFNTGVGAGALLFNTADQNTATGAGALLSNTTGNSNTAMGEAALFFNTTGGSNTGIGDGALSHNTTGGSNVAVGFDALPANTTGDKNTVLGDSALNSNTTGSSNTVIGFNSGFAVTTANNVVCIGAGVSGANQDNGCFIGSIFGQASSGGTAVFIDSNNKLGTVVSSKRFKEEIKPMDKMSEALFSLKPVTFHYKKEIDPAKLSQLGLVAEDVEKVNPNLIVRDKEGKPYTVRYDQVNAMLLNEFLKEHKKVQEQGAAIAQLKSGIETLTATVKQQAAQIQKVSARLEVGKPESQMVLNNQ
jgi:hypothetical protein